MVRRKMLSSRVKKIAEIELYDENNQYCQFTPRPRLHEQCSKIKSKLSNKQSQSKLNNKQSLLRWFKFFYIFISSVI